MGLQPKAEFGTFTLAAGETLTLSREDGVVAVVAYNKSGADCTVTGTLTINGKSSAAQVVADTESWGQVAYDTNSAIDGLVFTCGVADGFEIVCQK